MFNSPLDARALRLMTQGPRAAALKAALDFRKPRREVASGDCLDVFDVLIYRSSLSSAEAAHSGGPQNVGLLVGNGTSKPGNTILITC